MNIITILEYVKDNPDSDSIIVASNIGITPKDAAVRLYKLKISGLIKVTDKKRPIKYIITKFGIAYLKKKHENPGKIFKWHACITKEDRKKLGLK